MFVLVLLCVFFAGRRRHTSCALGTGVQTCALPIYANFAGEVTAVLLENMQRAGMDNQIAWMLDAAHAGSHGAKQLHERSDERRVGQECVRTCRSRWSPYHSTQKTMNNT